jgi:hypothetical protein
MYQISHHGKTVTWEEQIGEHKHLFEVVLLACIYTSSAWRGTEGPVGCRFSWDEVQYPTTTPLREVVNAIQDSVAKLDLDDVCKVYNPAPLCFTVLKRAEHDNVRVRIYKHSVQVWEKRSFCWTSFKVILQTPLWLSLWFELLSVRTTSKIATLANFLLNFQLVKFSIQLLQCCHIMIGRGCVFAGQSRGV